MSALKGEQKQIRGARISSRTKRIFVLKGSDFVLFIHMGLDRHIKGLNELGGNQKVRQHHLPQESRGAGPNIGPKDIVFCSNNAPKEVLARGRVGR